MLPLSSAARRWSPSRLYSSPPGVQGLGVVGSVPDPLRQALDHQAQALLAHPVYHPLELPVFLRWFFPVHPVMFFAHDAPLPCIDVPPNGATDASMMVQPFR